LSWSAVLIVLVLLGYSPQYADWLASYSAKTGRVIDEQTKTGIPDATVVSRGFWSSGGLYTTSSSCVYSVLARTDKNGIFDLPPAWENFTPGAPWFGQHNRWEITAFAPGFVFAGDTERMSANPQSPDLGSAARSVAFQRKGTSIVVSDLLMEKASLPLEQKVHYYAHTTFSDGCPEMQNAEFTAFRKRIFEDLRSSVCSLDSVATTDAETVRALRSFSVRLTERENTVSRFDQRFAALDPAYGLILSNQTQDHRYRVGDLCEVMTAMENHS